MDQEGLSSTTIHQTPYIISVSVATEDYPRLGYNLDKKHYTTSTFEADTGCQSCVISAKHLQRLGLEEEDLIPATMRIKAANNNSMPILGAAILLIKGRSANGDIKETRQVVYATEITNRFFLSRQHVLNSGSYQALFPQSVKLVRSRRRKMNNRQTHLILLQKYPSHHPNPQRVH